MKPNFSPFKNLQRDGYLDKCPGNKSTTLAYCVLLFACELNNPLLLRSVHKHHR